MISKAQLFILTLFSLLSASSFASLQTGRFFDRAIIVIFENTNYTVALKQPFFNQLAQNGAQFSNFMAETHPSQGNYIALTSASLNGVSSDGVIDLNVNHVADLLEAKGLTWKVYVEDYPGSCFIGGSSGHYSRKHNPFISYLNIQKNASRCTNIVNANQFDQDAASGSLPNYIFYVPNNLNSGHDTDVTYADKWYGERFSKFVNDQKFMQNTILISTFDESGPSFKNHIYTNIFGPAIKPGIVADQVNHYSVLKMLEENWNLGNLSKEDIHARSIPNIWRE